MMCRYAKCANMQIEEKMMCRYAKCANMQIEEKMPNGQDIGWNHATMLRAILSGKTFG